MTQGERVCGEASFGGIVRIDAEGFSPEIFNTPRKDNGWLSASVVALLGPEGIQDKGPCLRSKLKTPGTPGNNLPTLASPPWRRPQVAEKLSSCRSQATDYQRLGPRHAIN